MRPFVVFVLLTLAASAPSAEIIDRVLAVVSGQVIAKSDVDAAAALGIARSLQELIDRIVMLNEVRRVAPPEPNAEAVAARAALMRSRFSSPDALARALAVTGIDEATLTLYAADELRLSGYLDERFSSASQPTEEEIRQAGESARARLAAERRQALIAAWVIELRRRADITVLQ